jgi:hypothetical protein
MGMFSADPSGHDEFFGPFLVGERKGAGFDVKPGQNPPPPNLATTPTPKSLKPRQRFQKASQNHLKFPNDKVYFGLFWATIGIKKGKLG